MTELVFSPRKKNSFCIRASKEMQSKWLQVQGQELVAIFRFWKSDVIPGNLDGINRLSGIRSDFQNQNWNQTQKHFEKPDPKSDYIVELKLQSKQF
jgi:hypothetical protein